VGHVLATQTLPMRRPRLMRVSLAGRMGQGVAPKDLVLFMIGRLGAAVGTGYFVEYAGPAVRALPIEGRLTLCNMSIELGARCGIIAPDDATFAYLAGRPFAPEGAAWDAAVAAWRALSTDGDAAFDAEHAIDCDAVEPQI